MSAPSMPEPDITIEKISAITLATADMARAVAFYQSLGMKLLYGGAETHFSSLGFGACYINLQMANDGDGQQPMTGWGRVILYVADVDAFHAQVRAAGHRPEFEPRDAAWGERYFHLRDPDGHEISFARRIG